MISLETGIIQQKNVERAWLNAGIESYLAAGGKVIEAPGFISKPIPAVTFNGGTERERTAPQHPVAQPVLSTRDKLIANLRELSATMTAREAAEAAGTSRRTACILAKENKFSFQPGKKFAIEANINRRSSPEQDAKDVERLRAFCSIGVTLHQAALHMGYCRSRVQRLAEMHGIEFATRRRAGSGGAA